MTTENPIIKVGDVVLCKRLQRESYEFYQLIDEKENIPRTGFPQLSLEKPDAQQLIGKSIGDAFEKNRINYTIQNFFAPEIALHRLMSPDKTKQDPNHVYRGDYVLCAFPKRLEVIRWGLENDTDLNVLGLRCFYHKGVSELPEPFIVGTQHEHRTQGIQRQTIKVESALSNETFQKRFGIK